MKKAVMEKEKSCKKLEEMFRMHSYEDYKWISPKGIVVAQWARMNRYAFLLIE